MSRAFTRLRHEAAGAHAENKVNQNDDYQTDTDDSGTPAFVVDALDVATLADLVHAPDIQEETVDEGAGGEDGEGPGGNEGGVIGAEVEECCGDAAEDDREFQPGEEGSLGGKVDLRFHANGDENA